MVTRYIIRQIGAGKVLSKPQFPGDVSRWIDERHATDNLILSFVTYRGAFLASKFHCNCEIIQQNRN